MADLKHHDFLGKLEEDSLTVWESPQFKALGQRALDEGPDRVLQKLLDKPQLENAEMLWLLKQLTYFYGKPDDLLLKVPARRLMLNMGALLRVLYVFLDAQDPELDANLRSYMSAKLRQAAWGVDSSTRKYLDKL